MVLFCVTNHAGIFTGAAEESSRPINLFCIQLQATMLNNQQKSQKRDTCPYFARQYHPPHRHLPQVIPTGVSLKTATTAIQSELPSLWNRTNFLCHFVNLYLLSSPPLNQFIPSHLLTSPPSTLWGSQRRTGKQRAPTLVGHFGNALST